MSAEEEVQIPETDDHPACEQVVKSWDLPEVKSELETPDFLAMDLADEEQLKEVMRGRVVNAWVYEVKGHLQLTAVGVQESALMYARQKQKGIDISEVHESFSPDGTQFFARMKAVDLNTGASAIGAKAGPVGREFWYETILSKAERNAIRKLLPVSFITSIITMAVAQGKVKHLDTSTAAQDPAGPMAVPASPPGPTAEQSGWTPDDDAVILKGLQDEIWKFAWKFAPSEKVMADRKGAYRLGVKGLGGFLQEHGLQGYVNKMDIPAAREALDVLEAAFPKAARTRFTTLKNQEIA